MVTGQGERRRIGEWDALAEANLCASLAMLPGAEVTETGQFVRFRTGVLHSACNPIFGRDLPAGEAMAALIAENRAYYAAHSTPYRWYLTPRTTPEGIGADFAANGLARRETGSMAVELATLPEEVRLPEGCAMEEVRGAAQWAEWCQAFRDGYGLPAAIVEPLLEAYAAIPMGPSAPVRHYLARMGGKAVATTTLLLAGGAAGIYWVATVPEARGRGIGAAVTLTALLAGRAAGVGVGVLQATGMGHSVYRRLGFVDCLVWECCEEVGQKNVGG